MCRSEGSTRDMVRHVRERMNRRRDTVEQVVIPFSDADPAVSRKRTPPAPAFGTRAGASAVKSGATALDEPQVPIASDGKPCSRPHP